MQLSKAPIFHLPGVTPHPQPLVQRTKALDYAADEHDSMKISIVVWIRHHFSRGKQEINLDLMCAPEELPVSPCRVLTTEIGTGRTDRSDRCLRAV